MINKDTLYVMIAKMDADAEQANARGGIMQFQLVDSYLQ